MLVVDSRVPLIRLFGVADVVRTSPRVFLTPRNVWIQFNVEIYNYQGWRQQGGWSPPVGENFEFRRGKTNLRFFFILIYSFVRNVGKILVGVDKTEPFKEFQKSKFYTVSHIPTLSFQSWFVWSNLRPLGSRRWSGRGADPCVVFLSQKQFSFAFQRPEPTAEFSKSHWT